MKKQTFKTVILLVLFSVSFLSCKKDKEEIIPEEKKNQIMYDGSEYTLSQGLMTLCLQLNDSPPMFGYYLTFASPSISMDYSEDYPVYSGTGDGLTFAIISNSLSDLPDGTYNYSDNYNEFIFISGNLFLNYDWSDYNPSATANSTVKSGTIKIQKSGTNYEVTIDCIMDNDKPLTAYYNGSIDYCDASEEY
jgi:hypothetical protein